MKERKEVISKGVENVICTMGTQSKKPNQIIMSVPDDFVIEALDFYKKKRMNLIGDTGLVRFELVAVYAEEEILPAHSNDLNNADEKNGTPRIGSGHAGGDYYPKTTGTSESTEQKIQEMNDELDEVLDGEKL